MSLLDGWERSVSICFALPVLQTPVAFWGKEDSTRLIEKNDIGLFKTANLRKSTTLSSLKDSNIELLEFGQ